MTQSGRLSSTFGVPVVALKENMASIKSSAEAEGLDLAAFSVRVELTSAIDELSDFLEHASLCGSPRRGGGGGGAAPVAPVDSSAQLHSGAVVDGGEEGSHNSTGKASQLHSGALVDGGEEGSHNSTGKN